jgi:octaprenyl-diphosphate synthase
LLAQDLKELDRLIRLRLHSDVALIRSVAEYIISGGGKRLRPILVLLASGACGYKGANRIEMAAVIEFIHTATLLHDDVVDESDLRRGRKTANTEFGNAASVLVGDFLYSRAFQMMLVADDMRVMSVLASATNTIAEGEVLQLMNTHNLGISEGQYLEVIRRKTAALFEAAARLGAIVAGASKDVEEGLASYGAHLGTAFQLIDDALDYMGETATLGKNVGDDLREGKVTLPLIHVMRTGTESQRSIVRAALEGNVQGNLAQVCGAIAASGALQYTRDVARAESLSARTSLTCLPDSEFKNSLLELSKFAVDRVQ